MAATAQSKTRFANRPQVTRPHADNRKRAIERISHDDVQDGAPAQPASVVRSGRPESTKTQCTATSDLISWLTCGRAWALRSAETATNTWVACWIDQLIEAINGAQNRDGISLGMEGQMPAPGPQARRSSMTRVDEPHDRQAAPWFLDQAADQPTRIAAAAPPKLPGSGAAPAKMARRSAAQALEGYS